MFGLELSVFVAKMLSLDQLQWLQKLLAVFITTLMY